MSALPGIMGKIGERRHAEPRRWVVPLEKKPQGERGKLTDGRALGNENLQQNYTKTIGDWEDGRDSGVIPPKWGNRKTRRTNRKSG